jgi:hypothetical protein
MRHDKRLAYQGKIQALLKEWGSQIDRWQERARGDSQGFIRELNQKRQAVRSRLAAMKSDDGEQWKDRRLGLDHAVEEMREAMNKARDRFR